jgi:hypothetical protein
VPLQASVIETRVFLAMGGFNPEAIYAEDNDLARRLALREQVQGVPALIACLALGEANSTTATHLARGHSWASREKVLEDRRCFARLRAGTDGAYWRGRIVRCYLTSAWWNMRRGLALTGLRRIAAGLAALALAVPHLWAPRFWQAITRTYDNPTFARGLAESVTAG